MRAFFTETSTNIFLICTLGCDKMTLVDARNCWHHRRSCGCQLRQFSSWDSLTQCGNAQFIYAAELNKICFMMIEQKSIKDSVKRGIVPHLLPPLSWNLGVGVFVRCLGENSFFAQCIWAGPKMNHFSKFHWVHVWYDSKAKQLSNWVQWGIWAYP